MSRDDSPELSELRQYLSTVGHKIRLLILRIEQLKQRNYPTRHPIDLAESLTRILSRSLDELGRLYSLVGKMKSSDLAMRAWLIHRFAFRVVSHWIEPIDQANVSSTTGGMIDAFDAICNKAQFGTCLIVYPSWRYNFRFDDLSADLSDFANLIRTNDSPGVFAGLYPHYVILTYPFAVEETSLGQIILAHEVGHYIDIAQSWSKDIIENQTGVFDSIDSMSDSIPDGETSSARLLLNSIGASWIYEIVADSIAISIAGPAYILALEEFTMSGSAQVKNTNKISKSHPPNELRLQLMSQLTLALHFNPLAADPHFDHLPPDTLSVLEKIQTTLNSYAESESLDIQGIQETSLSPEAARWVYSNLVQGMRNVVQLAMVRAKDTLTEDWTCSHSDVLNALVLQEYLGDGLTPTELPEPFADGDTSPSFAAAINSGWFYLSKEKDRGRFLLFESESAQLQEKVNKDYVAVHQRVAKAIEILNFKRQFLHQKGAKLD